MDIWQGVTLAACMKWPKFYCATYTYYTYVTDNRIALPVVWNATLGSMGTICMASKYN